jgi:hypothetical protein
MNELGEDWTPKSKKAWVCAFMKMAMTMRGETNIMDFPRANDETVLDDNTQRFDDSMRGLIGENNDGDTIPIPNRKKN